MADWVTQDRYDIERLSTKALIELAKDEVDTARHFARADNSERSPADMVRNARSALLATQSIRRRTRWCCRLTKKAKSRRSTAPDPGCH